MEKRGKVTGVLTLKLDGSPIPKGAEQWKVGETEDGCVTLYTENPVSFELNLPDIEHLIVNGSIEIKWEPVPVKQ